MTPLTKPVTRLTQVLVRDGGRPRPLVASLRGNQLVLRAFGRRQEEVVDLEAAYLGAIKARKWHGKMLAAQAKAERKRAAAPRRRRSAK